MCLSHVCLQIMQFKAKMAITGILKEDDIRNAIDACQGEYIALTASHTSPFQPHTLTHQKKHTPQACGLNNKHIHGHTQISHPRAYHGGRVAPGN